MFEEEEEIGDDFPEDFKDSNPDSKDSNQDSVDSNPDSKTDSKDFVLEGKRWADGGFQYGFDASTASVDFLRQRSRRTLKKANSISNQGTVANF